MKYQGTNWAPEWLIASSLRSDRVVKPFQHKRFWQGVLTKGLSEWWWQAWLVGFGVGNILQFKTLFFFQHLLRIKYTVLCIYKSMLARRLYGVKGYIDYKSYWTVMTWWHCPKSDRRHKSTTGVQASDPMVEVSRRLCRVVREARRRMVERGTWLAKEKNQKLEQQHQTESSSA